MYLQCPLLERLFRMNMEFYVALRCCSYYSPDMGSMSSWLTRNIDRNIDRSSYASTVASLSFIKHVRLWCIQQQKGAQAKPSSSNISSKYHQTKTILVTRHLLEVHSKVFEGPDPNAGTSIITNIMVPRSPYTYSIIYLEQTDLKMKFQTTWANMVRRLLIP